MPAFRLGINYWPARTAMGWWTAFDASEVAADFARISLAGFDSVRLFLGWEHFQPRPDEVDRAMVERLVTTLDRASDAGLSVMPTLFTGHMSGVNWIPEWALGGGAGDARFRVVSRGRVLEAGLRNWFTDPLVARAQAVLATELARALRAHPALLAWDLGNENSNCVIPPTRAVGREWLLRVTDAVRAADDRALVTIGLHMEDLEQDRRLGPAEAAEACDFLTMHGYPGYATWSRGPTDELLLPFLTRVTSWLGSGADVLFSEFGVPTRPMAGNGPFSPLLVEEPLAAEYVGRALHALLECGATGALLWCHADYVESLWYSPPFDLAVHERHFGLWRANGTPKPALAAVSRFGRQRARRPAPEDAAWLDIEPPEFHLAPAVQLARLYGRYCITRE